MYLSLRIISLFLLLCIAPLGLAQSSDLGNWLIYIGNKQLNSKWNLHHEVQHRNYNAIGDLEQLLLRTGVGYTIAEDHNVLLGYGYIHSQNYSDTSPDEKVAVNEHRIFQQYIAKQTVGRVHIQHRYRFEQRWIEELPVALRLRYFLSLNIPLNKRAMEPNTLYFSTYNELFVRTKDDVFDRNRLFLGLGYRVSKGVRLEAGYMNQFFEVGGRDQINIIGFISF